MWHETIKIIGWPKIKYYDNTSIDLLVIVELFYDNLEQLPALKFNASGLQNN